jgi:hypothetical protein
MQESFLHYVWQFQYFGKEALTTSDGEKLNILHPGFANKDSGPDFSNGRITLGQVQWNGHIEIHVKTSEWMLHNHQQDEAYNNVILHVVWENDKPAYRKDGTEIPTLELKNRVKEDLILKYSSLHQSPVDIPCQNQIQEVNKLTFLSMLDRALMQRLQLKSQTVQKLLIFNNNDWEETAYQVLAKNFGFKVNSESFLELSKRLPYKVLLKHKNNIQQIEALLFGMAGFLTVENEDEYYNFLKREYNFLKIKYRLNKEMNGMEWKFLRLRPANFPTIRIAQFATLINSTPNLFSFFINSSEFKDIVDNFRIQQSPYWKAHYLFGKKSKSKIPGLGMSSIDNIITNTIVPLLVAYSRYNDTEEFIDKAIKFLEALPKEENHILNNWKDIGIHVKNAYDSQALLELYNNFCKPKKCLSCNIGTALIR